MIRDVNHRARAKSQTFLSFVGLFLLILLTNSHAGTTGKVSGRVVDKTTSEPLPGANVTVEGTNLGASTDLFGNYSIINIPPGKYSLVFQYIGYAKLRVNNVNVSVDRTATQNVGLSMEALAGKEIVVEAQRPVIEIDRTQSAAVVNSETIKLMPVTTVKEVIELQAGVVDVGGALHFRGGRSREVSYVVDGIPVNNAYSQGGGNNVAIENSMVQELEVISGTFNAEYGQAQSGVVNIITKRPAKHFNGNVQLYSGDWFSNKNDVFLGVGTFNPLAEKDVQFSLTGPLLSDKIGFYITGRYNNWQSLQRYERRYMPYDGWKIAAYREWFAKYQTEDLSASQAIPIPDSLRTGDFSQGPLATGFNSDFSAKLSFYLSPQMSLTYQAFGSFSELKGSTSRAFRYQPDGRGTSKGRAITHNFHFHHMPWENVFYDLAFSYQYNSGESYYRKDNMQAIVPGDEGIQLISASADGFSLGSTDWFYAGKKGKNYRKKYQLNGNINWQINKYNFVKAGFILMRHNINVYSHGFRPTQEWANNQFPVNYQIEEPETEELRNPTFNEYWNYLDTVWWKDWEQTFETTPYITVPDSEIALWQNYDITPLEAAFYIQDKLELGELILNGGLRFDIFKPNEKYPLELRTEAANLYSEKNLVEASTKLQLSPRLGLSFPISDKGAFHASYGHFFQMPSFRYMFNGKIQPMTSLTLDGRLLGNANLKP
ncbi:MAG: TonB-dependent receptor plug domain-containing protein, partial [Calditrichaeota bacterium]|nr:TonB-dependent receptor plug domain-containing protein [Calditrichota bacterium]